MYNFFMTDWIGKVLGKARIERLIARGGMAEVYLATHITLNRPVAVKILLSYLENEAGLKTRFEREARVLANLRHPNIVQIYDFDLADGQPYFLMEYINGPTLAAYLRTIHAMGGLLSLPQIGKILVLLASALDYAHTQGVIHRDIKPGNMILFSKTIPITLNEPLPDDTEAVLTDFGLLRLIDASSLSISGTVFGTPAYMAPEQARGENATQLSDLYSLGVVLYEMLAGHVPFDAETGVAILMKHIHEKPAPIQALPAAIQNVLDRALAKEPRERYETAQAMLIAFLEAANLTMADITPAGYNTTPPPGFLGGITPINERITLPPSTTPLPKPRKPGKYWLLATPALAALAFGLFYFTRPIQPPASMPTTTKEDRSNEMVAALGTVPIPAVTATEMTPPAISTEEPGYGLLRFFDVAGTLDEAILALHDFPAAPDGMQYEAWLVGEEVHRSMGVLDLDASGSAELTFLDSESRNLLARFDRLEITQESNPDNNPSPSGVVVFSSGLPLKALIHLRHVFVAFNDAPDQTGLLIGLIQNVQLVNNHAAAMLAAYQNQDAAGVRKNAEAVYNLLVGSQGKNYGDLDKNGKIFDPGDGYGLLLNGDNLGYIDGTILHIQYAMQMQDVTSDILIHGNHVSAAGENVRGWALELRDLLPQIIADPLGKNTNALIRQAAGLADRMLNGRDLNGNEDVEAIKGEGGAKTALDHAHYMLDMPILKGEGMLPPTPSAETRTSLPVPTP